MNRKLLCLALLALLFFAFIVGEHAVDAQKKKKRSKKAKAGVDVPATNKDSDDDITAVLRAKKAALDEEQQVARKAKKKRSKAPVEEALAKTADEPPAKAEKETQQASPQKTDEERSEAIVALKKQRRLALVRQTLNVDKARKRVQAQLIAARRRNKREAEQRQKLVDKLKAAELKEKQKQERIAKRRAEADTPSNRAKSQNKLKWLLASSAQSSGNIISMNEEEFKEYVHAGPRPYWLFVAFTALHPANQCRICQIVHPEMEMIAQAYESRRRVPSDLDSLFVAPDDQLPIFFVELDVMRNRNLFGTLGLNSAPTILLVPPKLSEKSGPMRNFLQSVHPKYKFVPTSQSISAEDLTGFINKLRPGARLDIERGVNYSRLVVYIVTLAGLSFFVYKFWEPLLSLRKHRTPFLIAAWCVYLFCIAGGMYNIIRDTPFSRRREDGSESYIAMSGRDQYGAEGYMMGAAAVVAGCFMVFLTKNAQKNPLDTKETKSRGMLAPVSKFLSGLPPHICLAATTFCWFNIVYVYTLKNNYYNYGMLAGR